MKKKERRKSITILGSTGSVGTATLDVVRAFGDRFRVAGLAAASNRELLAEQIELFRPDGIYLKNTRPVMTFAQDSMIALSADSQYTAIFDSVGTWYFSVAAIDSLLSWLLFVVDVSAAT